jgi:type IV pilus assembly protein PilV
MKYSVASTHDRGFSLVEVMVAVVVICVGLLGIAKMQALALSNTTTSRLRALAAIEAAGLASAMHSNREYWASAAPPATTDFSITTAGQVTSTDAALQTDTNNVLPVGLNTPDTIQSCVGTAADVAMCGGGNVVNLAAFDLARWAASLNALLPNPQSRITCQAPAGGTAPPSCTIMIQWSEKAVGMTQQEAQDVAQGQFELPSYILYVEP